MYDKDNSNTIQVNFGDGVNGDGDDDVNGDNDGDNDGDDDGDGDSRNTSYMMTTITIDNENAALL